MPISARQLVGSTLALLAIGFLALAAIVGSNIWLGARAQVYSQDVIAVRDAKAMAVDIRLALQAAESSQRGHLYTGNEIYLSPYGLSKSRAQTLLKGLPAALATYGNLDGAVVELERAISERVSEMDKLIEMKRAGDDQGAADVVRTNRGKFLMDEIGMLLNGATLAIDKRLTALTSEQERNSAWLRFVSVAGGAVILVAAFLALYAIATYTRDLAGARRDLAMSNEKLEQRVASRTAELAVANTNISAARDRAEALLSEVNHRVANSLSLVTSLISIQLRSESDPAVQVALEEIGSRVRAIAKAHQHLYGGQDVQSVALEEYLTGLIEAFSTTAGAGEGFTVSHRIEPMSLPTEVLIWDGWPGRSGPPASRTHGAWFNVSRTTMRLTLAEASACPSSPILEIRDPGGREAVPGSRALFC